MVAGLQSLSFVSLHSKAAREHRRIGVVAVHAADLPVLVDVGVDAGPGGGRAGAGGLATAHGRAGDRRARLAAVGGGVAGLDPGAHVAVAAVGVHLAAELALPGATVVVDDVHVVALLARLDHGVATPGLHAVAGHAGAGGAVGHAGGAVGGRCSGLAQLLARHRLVAGLGAVAGGCRRRIPCRPCTRSGSWRSRRPRRRCRPRTPRRWWCPCSRHRNES